MKTYQLEILSPAKEIYKGEVKSVSVPGEKSPFQILFNHAPIISTLTKGKIKIIDANDQTQTIDIESGTVEVLKNKVQILVKN
ncbi:MAG TPA: ATP synthase F1 subunit epsilon [Ignavibacteriales bacterium]|nr:ATP synthase F1 subunit epsilon [Ignavibacteriales bacterium]HOL81429.1 ATP synthase F1 subunit epsilon [Ignavibacteriales bacterium]HOM65543.1 ATP synthase F1 subunit epsilon [Ignavibacteriales bacterium]HPD68162.1 ATP synthase F1 subunit epsilon [Ignavibacteriales bacterium]HPP34341.1 ATP synthase F1 subunit epsilon [Ignavibacteriales bacterium]